LFLITTVLYKQGPEFHHASYSVIVGNLNTFHGASEGWVQLATANRISESASKVGTPEIKIQCNIV